MAAAAFSYRSNKHSDSESDDSDGECTVWKRASRKTSHTEELEKIPIEQPLENSAPVPISNTNNLKRKRNNVWCDVLQDQMISETLNHCGIKNKPADYFNRGEESYDYTLSYKYQKKEEEDADLDDQMSADDTSETSSVYSNKSFKSKKNDKFVHLDSAELAAARKIIKVLCEPKRHLIYRVVKYLGVEKAIELMKMTEDIEENGGMMINNNQRRRTPGGVFFQLLKADKHIEKSAIDKIFEGEMTSFDRKKYFEEKRKMKKKLEKERKLKKKTEKARLQKFAEDMELSQPPKNQEESRMEEESMPMEEPRKQNF
ncbi:Phosphorylated adapter RNA export protein like [Argiope bruennichi]|uniref:Phosphorylated adapter RNA export protein n=1 Tax=Argiope bruennichi TaxID=94029 RepID=A0A8T0EDH2_ARGBR|nr:Phosphorylated adapter RNA export protein like [Argiope bruennichi]